MSALRHADESVTLHHGDCLDVLRQLPDCSVDSIVTDPPYGLGFMGKEWDSGKAFVERKAAKGNTFDHVGGNHNPSNSADAARTRRAEGAKFGAWCEQWAAECLRVLKPGGHILAFGGSRTWHRLASAIEDAGFEIRDSIAWLYGSGFPKSLDVSKAIDKAAGAERTEVVGKGWHASTRGGEGVTIGRFAEEYRAGDAAKGRDLTAPATPDAERWQGWGTALKPAFEPVVVGRKPLASTVATNVLAHGTGALNIDGCRIGSEQISQHGRSAGQSDSMEGANYAEPAGRTWSGRWPANVILDESQADALDQQSGERGGGTGRSTRGGGAGGDWNPTDRTQRAGQTVRGDGREIGYGDTGGASRFFYVAKAPKSQRPRTDDGTAHPTVKPLALMRWLVRLVTPPGGTVLEPFAGSGTTVEACLLEGFQCIAIEREVDYLPLIEARIDRAAQKPKPEPDLFSFDDEEASA